MNENLRPTKNLYVLILIFLVSISMGTILRLPELIILSLPVFLYVLLSIIGIKGWEINVERNFSENIYFQNESAKVTIKIESISFSGFVKIKNSMIEETYSIKKGQKIVYNKTINFREFGIYDFSTIEITLSDFSYLFVKSYTIKNDLTIQVFPEYENVRKFKIKPKRTRSLLGDIPSRYIGSGTDFYAVREFNPGDEKRRINWKRTAMFDRLMVNDYYAEKSGNTVILLDVRRFQKSENDYNKILNGSVRAALTITNAIARTRNRLGLVILKDTVDWVYPSYGKRQYYKITERLLRVRSLKESYIPLEYGGKIITRFFPPNSFIIIIGTVLDKNLNELIMDMIAKKYEILMIIPYFSYGEGTLSEKIMDAERKVRIRTISKYARVIEWNMEYPLTKYLERLG